MELENILNTLTEQETLEAELEQLPDPLETAREAAAQLEEAASLLRGVVNTLESLEA